MSNLTRDQKEHHRKYHEVKPKRTFSSLGLVLGAGLGILASLLLLGGNFAISIGVGAALGILGGSVIDTVEMN